MDDEPPDREQRIRNILRDYSGDDRNLIAVVLNHADGNFMAIACFLLQSRLAIGEKVSFKFRDNEEVYVKKGLLVDRFGKSQPGVVPDQIVVEQSADGRLQELRIPYSELVSAIVHYPHC